MYDTLEGFWNNFGPFLYTTCIVLALATDAMRWFADHSEAEWPRQVLPFAFWGTLLIATVFLGIPAAMMALAGDWFAVAVFLAIIAWMLRHALRQDG